MPPIAIKLIAAVIIAVVFVVALNAYGAAKLSEGKALGRAEVKAEIEEQNKKLATVKKKVKHETQGLDRNGIIRELCVAGWVRNPDKCPH